MKQREIKFRAWTGEKIIYDYLVARPQFCDPLKVMTDADFAKKTYGFKDYVLMQYTGLKDKNGKEIYEGDILKHPIEKRWFNWLIEFSGGSFCLINIGVDGYRHEPMYLTQDRVSEREIIGNIYENPNLLTP